MEMLTCGVVAVGEYEALARHVYEALRVQAPPGMNVAWHPRERQDISASAYGWEG
jgi:hypothetical protein